MSTERPEPSAEHAPAPRVQTETDPVHQRTAEHESPRDGEPVNEKATLQALDLTPEQRAMPGMPVIVTQLPEGVPAHYVAEDGALRLLPEAPLADNDGTPPGNLAQANLYLFNRLMTHPNIAETVSRHPDDVAYVTVRPPQITPRLGVRVLASVVVSSRLSLDVGGAMQELRAR